MLISNPQNEKTSFSTYLGTRFERVFLQPVKKDSRQSTNDSENPTQELGLARDNGANSTILMPGQTLPGTGFKVQDLRGLVEEYDLMKYHGRLTSSFDRYEGSHPPWPHISLTAQDVTRYKMAWRAVEFFQQINYAIWWCKSDLMPLVQRCKDWPDIYTLDELPTILSFTIAALIYGGLHALAWFAHFESSTQQLLWRISACVVMGAFPATWIFWSAGYNLLNIKIRRYSAVVALVALAYMLARAYLVVECFINLSHLPAGAYDVPSWSAYFPHIS